MQKQSKNLYKINNMYLVFAKRLKLQNNLKYLDVIQNLNFKSWRRMYALPVAFKIK